MMVEIINLRRVRKQKQRSDAAQQAAENRALHGRTKADKQKDAQEQARAERAHDGHKLDEED